MENDEVMNEDLTKEDLDIIMESLTTSKYKVRDEPNDLTNEAKMKRVLRYEGTLKKVRE